MFPFLQFVNLAGRDSCLLLRGFLAKKPAQVSATEFSLRAGPRAVQHPSHAAAGQRFAGCLSSKEAGSGPPTCRKGRPVLPPWWRGARPGFHSTWIGGWWRRMRAITRDFRNPGRRCCAQRLGGRVVRHRPLQLLTSAGTVKSATEHLRLLVNKLAARVG